MKILTTIFVASLSVLSLPALAVYGTPFDGWGFVAEDWQVVCDNTLTCRAAGYTKEEYLDHPASILLVAEPKKALPKAYVTVLTSDEKSASVSGDNPSTVELWLNDKSYGAIRDDQLNAEQTKQIIRHARINTKIELRGGNASWIISDKGMSAVLLKLDEVQGRVGTSLALVSQDSANKQTPKSAKAKPIVRKSDDYLAQDKKQLDAKKLAYFQANINKWIDIDAVQFVGSADKTGDCELINPSSEAAINIAEYAASSLGWDFIPINANYTLASHLCWRGAYNIGVGYWTINNANPSKPQFITSSGTEYYDGEISAIHRDRGIGDCWNSKTWVWDGKRFAMTEDSSSGMCRGFVGGAWDLPTYVSEVIKKSKPSN
ncbi:DUF1176 domain-containing protein [Psychrobacter urativorans]|uniref:DUF1176 domain-containing protein n=1 Tax=Psychrobacter urativorans TaxID=45610 RepID=UPI003BB793C6